VIECLGSCLTNKYSEGYPGKRYYGGNEFIDKIENIAISRALAAFGLDAAQWGVNVQPYSGSPANFEVYTALLSPHDRIMGLDLPSGGHLTHGFYTATKKVSATSVYFESLPYKVDPKTGLVDFEKLRESAKTFRPKIIICGGSAYARDWDYVQFRAIADEVGAILMCDMAHFAGLAAAGVVKNPFEYCDIVTTTTHKTLRGPRAGMIFYKKDARGFEDKVSQAVFPGCQGGPHNHQIAAIAVQMKEVASEEWKGYATQVQANARTFCAAMQAKGYEVVSNGTDTHLVLLNLRNTGISGGKMQVLCDELDITLNKNSVPGDVSAVNPGGVRIGAPAMTSRGCVEADFEQIASFLHTAIELAKKVDAAAAAAATTPGPVKLAAFQAAVAGFKAELEPLREEVRAWASKFFMPGC
jgi:glycine hydroxymethyltransferase